MCLFFQLQAAEMEQMRTREANLTALAAIGHRKKRKLEEAGSPVSVDFAINSFLRSYYCCSQIDLS